MTDASPVEPTFVEDVPSDPNALSKFHAIGFFPADYAVVENGKVYASGAYWATLRIPRFPHAVANMSLVAVIGTPFHANQADHTLEMRLVDSDQKPHGMEVRAIFRTAPGIDQKYGQAGAFPSAVSLSGLMFERPGEYSFTLSVDGTELARYPFSVIQLVGVPSAPVPPPPVQE